MPILHAPGVITPGQLGPIKRELPSGPEQARASLDAFARLVIERLEAIFELPGAAARNRAT